MNDMNMYAVIAITILGGIGLTVLFFSALMAIAHAFGNKRLAWGIVSILLLPISALYCFIYWKETSYPRKYLFVGLGLMLLTFIAYLFLYV